MRLKTSRNEPESHDRIGCLLEEYEGRWPHTLCITTAFWDRKMRWVLYVSCYSLEHAKSIIRAFASEGMDATAIKKYDRISSKDAKFGDVSHPVYLVYFTKSKVLYSLHKSWYENGRQLWPK